MTDIFQQLWNADVNRCSVALRGSADWDRADVQLDVQVEAAGRRNRDLATEPLFANVNEDRFKGDTFRTFLRLLDNYVVDYRASEEISSQERAEIHDFLDAIFSTKVMQLAHAHVHEALSFRLTETEFRAAVERMWFTLFTNWFNGKSTSHCSGFEHVFVGEGKYDPRFGGAETLGEISGYHNWLKFYFDEAYGRVNFLGHKYDLKKLADPASPNVVTLQMEWTHSDLRGAPLAKLFKKKGGFFVGTSPECEVAMGTVAFFESARGHFSQKRKAVIGNESYNLVLYRNVKQGGGFGDFVRSFYPEYLGPTGPQASDVERVVVESVPPVVSYMGANLQIAAAEPNPLGEDSGKEWVSLRNDSGKDVSLKGYQLRDKHGRVQNLAGLLQAGADLKIELKDRGPGGFQLGNGGGLIALYDADRLVAQVAYSAKDARSGAVVSFVGEGGARG